MFKSSNNVQQRTIAFFDFDGTITTKDSMLELAKFSRGAAGYYAGMVAISPYLIAMKIGLLSNDKAKEKLLSHFFGDMSLNDFNTLCRRFCNECLPSLIRPAALKKIKEYQAANIEVVIVSASAENWISDWCNDNGIKYIATKLKVVDGKITGKLDGINCNGIEKVNRIKLLYDPANYSTIYCYGDSSGDQPMLQLATESFFKPFR